MPYRAISSSLACALALAACAGCTSSSGTLRVTNDSDFAIVEMHVAPNGSTTWGGNLLSGDVLAPGDTLTIDTACDTYDVLLVDEQGVDCEIDGIDLCANSADFVIRNDTCAVFSRAAVTRNPSSAGTAAAPAARK